MRNKATSSETTRSGDEDARRLVAATLAELEQQLEVVRARRAELPPGGFDKDLAAAAASLSRAVTGLASEERARERARVQAFRKLLREMVIGWLRDQSDDERHQLIMQITAMSETNVLG